MRRTGVDALRFTTGGIQPGPAHPNELGIRRTRGALRRDIQRQLLTEAIILSVIGGVPGVMAGVAVTSGMCQYTGWEFLISTPSTVVGLGVSTAVGLVFGSQPAHQAARVDPIVALQGE